MTLNTLQLRQEQRIRIVSRLIAFSVCAVSNLSNSLVFRELYQPMAWPTTTADLRRFYFPANCAMQYLSVNGVTCSDFLSDTYPDLRCVNGSYGMLPPVLVDECDGLWSRTAPTTITIDLFAYVS